MKKHGCLWWLCVSWWWLPIKWTFYSIPAFILRTIIPKTSKNQPSPDVPQCEPVPSTKDAPQNTMRPEPSNIKTYKATGMSYRLDALLSLGYKNDDYSKSKKDLIEEGLTEERIYEYCFTPQKVELVPEPTNQYDPNAIKVVVDGVHVAYIKAGSCAHLLKVIKGNRIKKITCEIKGGKYKYLSCDYEERETYTLEKGEAPYSVVLHVTEE